jgi:hypothetical protein
MSEHASRLDTALYDQFEDEHPVADWGGDDLFTRMPRPRAVDDAPAPRFRPYLAAAEPIGGASDSTARASTSAARASASAARASGPSGPSTDSTGSAIRPSGPATDSTGSAIRPSGPATDSTGSATRSSGSTAHPPDVARRAPELALVESTPDPAAAEDLSPRERRLAAGTAERAMLERAERLGLSVVELPHEPVHRWDESGTMIEPPPGR